MRTKRKSNSVYLTYRNAKQKAEYRLVGMPLRKHLIENICRIMVEYAPAVYLTYRNAKQKAEYRLVGMPLRKHLIENICRIMVEYAPAVGVLKKEIEADLKAIRAWKLDAVEDWFYIYDALGYCDKLDAELSDFCAYARARWWYNQLSRLTK